jgi:hypothetical protein
MRGRTALLSFAMVCPFAPLGAQAQPLKVVEVSAPAVNCVFHADCRLLVNDTIGQIPFGTISPGNAWLQSRVFEAEAGTPAGAGTIGYNYRISLTQASGQTDCIASFVLNFGPHKPLPYKDSTLADVYVVTGGGLGTISLASATRYGDAIEFVLKSALCLDGPPDVKNTTFFIGLAATAQPMHVNAQIAVAGPVPIYAVDARVPTHAVTPDPPGGL